MNDENKKTTETPSKIPFSEKHPVIYFTIVLCLLGVMILIPICLIWWCISVLGNGIGQLIVFLKKIVSTTDTVIIVAMITGSVSIIGVVFTSVIAKIVDYRYNVKKYLYDKREKPYKQFINMIYTIMEDTKKPEDERMTEYEMTEMVSKFSKGLTLWGSNKVVKKWLKYRKETMAGNTTSESLLLLEDIIYEIRKDVGQRKRLGKGDMLSIFINDIENLNIK